MKIIYTTFDRVSYIAGSYIEREYAYKFNEIEKIDKDLLFTDLKNEKDTVCFLSNHTSSKGIASFTTHSLGNFSDKAEMGGMPKTLVEAAPIEMLSFLFSIYKSNINIDKLYEATHHGPYVNMPAFFVELGGNEEIVKKEDYIKAMANALIDSIDNKIEPSKIVIGIGGMHYASIFTKIALSKRYAFSFIVSKHNVDYLDNNMLEQMINKTKDFDHFVIEKKGMNSEQREKVLKLINGGGYEYEMA